VKLLVIDDDAKVTRLLTRIFHEEGFVVDGCAKGEDGLRQATSGLYDLLVLDWMLPDVDGLTLCRRLRERGVSLPILMLTAAPTTTSSSHSRSRSWWRACGRSCAAWAARARSPWAPSSWTRASATPRWVGSRWS
jgi:CheY-like chemotaxis protein